MFNMAPQQSGGSEMNFPEGKWFAQELEANKKEHLRLTKKISDEKLHSKKIIEQLILEQEEEKKQISRELHDEIAQLLVGINYKLETLVQGPAFCSEYMKRKVKDAQNMVEESVSAIHQYAKDLRPHALENKCLLQALHQYLEYFTQTTLIKVNFKYIDPEKKLSDITKNTLFCVIKEALLNVAKHSNASTVTIKMSQYRKNLVVKVHDNGISFNVKKTLSLKTNKRIGLVGMKERIKGSKGKLKIESSPANGTTLKVQFPMEASA
jgi:two-component system sensor histidine kinase DegS